MGKTIKWEYTPEAANRCARWNSNKFEILKSQSNFKYPKPYDLYYNGKFLSNFAKLKTVKKVCQLINRG